MPSLQAAADNLKGYAFFLDADLVGICSPSFAAWLGEPSSSESFAISILVAHRRPIYRGEPGYDWIAGSEEIAANLRAAEIATVLARYIATLGFGATAHTASESALDLDRLALEAGVLEQVDGRLGHPLLSRGFGLAAVSTSLELPLDRPLAARSGPKNLRIKLSHAVGLGGTRPGWQRLGGQNRPWHLGRYPMETIPRSDKPTTLILADEVRRVPVRQNFFHRARAGDLGPRTLKEVQRFVVKAPHGRASLEVLQRLSGLRDGEVATGRAPGLEDPERNRDAVKALTNFLGADMTGVCEIPEYAWYSHRADGTEIVPDHKNAIVFAIDQGRETMEGASGDDWISGAQSMRAYLRGALIGATLPRTCAALATPLVRTATSPTTSTTSPYSCTPDSVNSRGSASLYSTHLWGRGSSQPLSLRTFR